MTTKLPWILSGLALLAAIYSFVLLLNAGAALDDARSEVARMRERSDLALSVLRKDWIGKDIASVTNLSKDLERQGAIVKDRAGSFEIGQLVFHTKDGVVTEIRYID
jgi:hypothetical protein